MVSLLNSPPPKCTIFFSGPNLPILRMIPALVPTTLCFTALSHVCHTTGLHFPPLFPCSFVFAFIPLYLQLPTVSTTGFQGRKKYSEKKCDSEQESKQVRKGFEIPRHSHRKGKLWTFQPLNIREVHCGKNFEEGKS